MLLRTSILVLSEKGRFDQMQMRSKMSIWNKTLNTSPFTEADASALNNNHNTSTIQTSELRNYKNPLQITVLPNALVKLLIKITNGVKQNQNKHLIH